MEKGQRVNKYKRIKDSFSRVHNYLRLSLTDRCNLRCSYCMPSKPEFVSKKKLLSANEIETLASVFTNMGVNKIRLTGGEPLVRNDFREIVEKIAKFNSSLHITTNGFYIDNHIKLLKENFSSINISLDTLKPERFKLITQSKHFHHIWNNIELVLSKNIPTKLNVVVIKNINHDEIIDFVKLSFEYPFEVRFIEFMPFKGNNWDISQTYTSQEILRDIKREHQIEFLGHSLKGTAERYKLKNAKGSFAFISTVSHPFCDQCNRIRITADGKLKNCLFGSEEYDLMPLFNNISELKNAIYNAFYLKHYSHGGNHSLSELCKINKYKENRCMTAIGG